MLHPSLSNSYPYAKVVCAHVAIACVQLITYALLTVKVHKMPLAEIYHHNHFYACTSFCLHTAVQWLCIVSLLAHPKLYPLYHVSPCPYFWQSQVWSFLASWVYFCYLLFIFWGLAYFNSIMFWRSHVVAWNRISFFFKGWIIFHSLYITFCLFVHTSVDIWIASTSWLFQIVLLWSGIL